MISAAGRQVSGRKPGRGQGKGLFRVLMIPAVYGALLFAGLAALHGAISTVTGRTARRRVLGVNPGRGEGAGLINCDPLREKIINPVPL
jgi:hypothetical protein